jgi:hydrogenase assembly chaperone HypC/HupF
MEWQIILILVLVVPMVLFPVVLIWYLNIAGVYAILRERLLEQIRARQDSATATVPYRILEVRQKLIGVVEVAGVRGEISLKLLPDVKPGDYVLCNYGHAIAKIDEHEALELAKLYQETLKAVAG